MKLVFYALAVVVGATLSVYFGQDTNWDLLNYHIRDPYSVFAGRLFVDLDPASLQSYFNPTLDIPFYLLATGPLDDKPRILAAVMGIPFGVLLAATLELSHRLFAPIGGWTGLLVTFLAAASAVTGAAALTQLGTTFNEVTISALVILGLLAVLPPGGSPVGGRRWTRMAAGGLFFGAAAGLKLTAAIAAPAICIALLAVLPFRRWLAAATAFSLSWIVAFLLLAGWWCWHLYVQFGNPFFPLYNGVFHSPWFAAFNFFDNAFLPKTAMQWLFYPFWWAAGQSRINSELVYRDPRLACFLVAGLVCFVTIFVRWLLRRPQLPHLQLTLLCFAAIYYGLWLYMFAIMRYAIVIEVTGTLTVMAVLVGAASGVTPRLRSLTQGGLVGIATLFYALLTSAPDYGHIAYGKRVFDIDMSWTPDDTLFVAITGPTAYVTAFVPPERGARTIGFSYLNRLAGDTLLTTQSRAIVAAHRGPIIVLIPPDDQSMLKDLPMIGLNSQLGPCRQIHSNLDLNRTKACEASRLPSPV